MVAENPARAVDQKMINDLLSWFETMQKSTHKQTDEVLDTFQQIINNCNRRTETWRHRTFLCIFMWMFSNILFIGIIANWW